MAPAVTAAPQPAIVLPTVRRRPTAVVLSEMASASAAMSLTSLLFNPFDVIKVRLQTQNTVVPSERLYNGLQHAASTILRQEGVRGLWLPGLTASILCDAINGGLRMGLYPSVKHLLHSLGAGGSGGGGVASSDHVSFPLKLLSGALTGAFGSFVGTPTDIVKIRFQAESGLLSPEGVYLTGLARGTRPVYTNTFQALRGLYQTGGVAGLYKGAVPNMVRASLVTAAQVASYDHSKLLFVRHGLMEEGASLFVVCGLISGLTATTIAAPADLIRTRVMNDRTVGGPRVLRGLQCLAQTVRYEGPAALFKGWVPAWLRLGPLFVISWPIMEFMRKNVFGLQYF